MPLVCFAPGCKSGYASERRTGIKHHYFRLPKDEELAKIWKCKIPRFDREMAAHDVLCDIHFDPKDVVTHDVFTIKGEIVKVARERYKLVTGAQPIHFPNPTNRKKTAKKRKNSTPDPKNKPKLCKTTRKPPQKHQKIIENNQNQHVDAEISPKNEEINPDVTKSQKLQRRNATLCRLLQIKRQKYTKLMNKLRQQADALAATKSHLKLYKPTTRKTQLVIKELVRRETRRTKTIRYHKDSILDSVLFRIKSPDGYLHCLRHGLAAQPSKASYSRLLSKLRAGFTKNNNSMQLLAEKLKNKSQNERLGVLALKEIEIHEAVDSNGKNMKFDGFVDCAEAASETADKGLIFAFKPLIGEWSLVITRYALRNETPGNILAKLFLEIIINVENVGAKVIAFISNGGEINTSAARSLGFDGRRGSLKNSVPHPYDPDTRRLFCLYDVPQVMKRVQTNLELRKAKSLQKLFSKSTATCLRKSGDFEEFTRYFSQLGAILNSDGLRKNSDNHKFLKGIDNTLNSAEAANNTVMSTKTLECLRLTTRSALQIYNFLWARGFTSICAGKLNQM